MAFFEAKSRLWQVMSIWKGFNRLTMAYRRADLQDVLHRNPVVHLRFRCASAWCSAPKPPFCWPTRDGVGNSHSRDHGGHHSSLCVSFHDHFGEDTKCLFFSDAHANGCFKKHQGEVSALLNLARTFGVAYFQVPWAIKHGALQTLGYEAAYVVCLTRPLISSSASILTSLMF
jgi:hypothetical protein